MIVVAGSNIEPQRNLPAALDRLRRRLVVESISSIYETPPVDAPGTPNFWNAAILVRSERAPARVKLEVLRPIEAELGRVRGRARNAPRPIDLDIVLWSGGPLAEAEAGLRLPDPDLATRAHLAIPASEVVPGWSHPASGRTLAELAAAFSGQATRIELEAWSSVPPADPRS